MPWLHLDDFDYGSWDGKAACAVCGSIKRQSETRIFRPPVTDDVSGSFDICEGCIREGASQLGLAETAGADRVIRKLEKEVQRLSDDLSGMRDALATMTRENVRLQDTLDELYEAEQLYGLEPEDESE